MRAEDFDPHVYLDIAAGVETYTESVIQRQRDQVKALEDLTEAREELAAAVEEIHNRLDLESISMNALQTRIREETRAMNLRVKIAEATFSTAKDLLVSEVAMLGGVKTLGHVYVNLEVPLKVRS